MAQFAPPVLDDETTVSRRGLPPKTRPQKILWAGIDWHLPSVWRELVLVVFSGRRWGKVAGALYPAVTVLVVVATANHYVLDIVAGFAIVAVTLTATRSGAWFGRRRRAPGNGLLLEEESGLIPGSGHKLTTPACIGDMPRVNV